MWMKMSIVLICGQNVCNVLKCTGLYVLSVGAMLFLKEMCTSGRKFPRKPGRSWVDFESFGRASRSSSDEKLEESRVVFLQYGGGTNAGTASELNGSQGSGYLAGYSSLGYHEVCTEEVPRQFVLSYGHLLLSLGSLFSLQR
jgi:hypothetical protein